jgi:predicted peptidase
MPETSAGIHLEKHRKQTYAISVPFRHTQGERVPLIMLLHWGGRPYRYIGREMLELFGLPAFSERQALLVAPDRKSRHWATAEAATDLADLIDFLELHYHIDQNQRAVAGFSMGGMGVWYLASEQLGMFSAGVTVASPIPDHLTAKSLLMPLFAVHSQLDEVFPFEPVASRAEELIAANAPLRFQDIPDASHADLRYYLNAMPAVNRWLIDQWPGA